MALADDDIRDVIARAVQIQQTSVDESDVEAVIQAAVGVGIDRAAVERALRERLGTPMRRPEPGELVFARSAGDRYHVAQVETAAGDEFRVRFLSGGTNTVRVEDIRPCTFLPGERVVCPWPMWGPWTCTVLSYDAASGIINVTDGWGDTRMFPIRDVWITPRDHGVKGRRRVYAALLGAGAAAGAAIGALVTLLLT